jgi:hypothetical protein
MKYREEVNRNRKYINDYQELGMRGGGMGANGYEFLSGVMKMS